MAKLNVMPTPNPKDSSDKEVRNKVAGVKRKRNFDVVDSQALYAVYPQFFKLIPDYAKIRQLIKLGLEVPGVKFHDDAPAGEEIE